MADAVLPSSVTAQASHDTRAWDRLKVDRNWLGAWFMLPTAAFSENSAAPAAIATPSVL